MPRKANKSNAGVAKRNFNHALAPCHDPDCEIHHPSVIEERPARLTAMAWYLAGVMAAHDSMSAHNNHALGKLVEGMRTEDRNAGA
jgi:hypothetical protein